MFMTNLSLIFLYVPNEQVMGVVQRIFYFHVPLVWMGFLSFLIVFTASIMYLANSNEKWDRLAVSAAEIGVVFMTAGIISGALWAKPVWGTWWTWDAKLTTTFILWVIYISYLMVRSFAPSKEQAARYSAVIGIIGFLDVPIVYMASCWWRTLHPALVTGPLSDSGGLEPSMRFTLYFSTITLTLLLGILLWSRIKLYQIEDTIMKLQNDHSRT